MIKAIKNIITWMPLKKWLVLNLILVLLFRKIYKNRKQIKGWKEVFEAFFIDLFQKSPYNFKNFVKEDFQLKNGEYSQIWWPKEYYTPIGSKYQDQNAQNSNSSSNNNNNKKKLWILLPGGMTSGNAYYIREAIRTGLFKDDCWAIYHNPGIVNKVLKRTPPGLTETSFLKEFLLSVKERGFQVMLMGFSAGSMLCTRMVEVDYFEKKHQIDTDQQTSLMGGVSIHGPDKIRHVFEVHKNSYLRLDKFFALSLYMTLIKANVHKLVGRQNVLRDNFFCWISGWAFMVKISEAGFEREWDEMEDEMWSCGALRNMKKSIGDKMSQSNGSIQDFNQNRIQSTFEDDIQSQQETFDEINTQAFQLDEAVFMEQKYANSKGKLPIFRVLNKYDPIVPYKTINQKQLGRLDKVEIYRTGGHCCAFRYCPDLAGKIKEWQATKW